MKIKRQPYILLTTVLFLMFNSAVAISLVKKTENVLSVKDTVEILTCLAEYEVDTSLLIQVAAENIKDKKLKAWLINAKEEREAHIRILNKLIIDVGQDRIIKQSNKNNVKKFHRSEFADLSNLKKDDEILKALAKEENKNLQKFSEILNLKLPHKAHVKVKNIHSHNKQHLEYLEHLITMSKDTQSKKAKG